MRERLELGSRIVVAAAIAVAAVLALELGAVFLYDESPSARNGFGYERDAGIVVDGDRVTIEPVSSRRFWPQSYRGRSADPSVESS